MRYSYFKKKIQFFVSRYFEDYIYFFERKRIENIFNRNKSIVLIYSIGKVGSSSVYLSLKKNRRINSPIFHVHSLNTSRLEKQKEYYRHSKRNSIPFHLIQGEIISNLLPTFDGKVYLFTLVREPIARELSSLFQDSFNFFYSSNLDVKKMDKIVRQKLRDLSRTLPEREWFENELKSMFGLEIDSIDFDPQTGWKIIKNEDNLQIAIIRLENLNSCFDQICKCMFRTNDDYELLKRNNSVNKFYYNVYNTIKNDFFLSKIEVDSIVNSQFIQEFYPDYIDEIRKRWQKDYESSSN